MRKTTLFLTLVLAAGGATILSASRDPGTQPTRDAGQPVTILRSPAQIQADQRAPSTHEGTAPETAQTSRAPAYSMKRFSVHTGGSAAAAGANLRSGVFVGETVLGRASSQSFRANVGFWFGPRTRALRGSRRYEL